MPEVLVITYSNLATDGRVLRQIKFLQSIPEIRLTVAAFGKSVDLGNDVKYIQLPISTTLLDKLKAAVLLRLKLFNQYDPSFGAVNYLRPAVNNKQFDLVIVNDIEPLVAVYDDPPIGRKVLLDAHEYAPLQFEDRWKFRFFFQEYMSYLCARYLKKVDRMITVSEGLQAEYLKEYGVSSELITNSPFYLDVKLEKKQKQKLVRMVYHGGATRSRKLEYLFDLMSMLDDRFTLDLMLLPTNSKYYKHIIKLARNCERVNIIDPVKPNDISKVLSEYDIGVYMMAPVNFNHKHALPNKLFEFIQARLVVAIWPIPGMSAVVKKTECGIISKDFTVASLAKELNKLSAQQIDQFKKNSNVAASIYCAEANRDKFCAIVKSLL